MFDLDKWQEIFNTIRQNPLRTFLTSFSVGWGILMLVTLLGLGKGLENGIRLEFQDDAINSIWIWGGRTTMPYEGLQPNRTISLTNDEFNAIESRVKEGEAITARYYIPGGTEIIYRGEAADYSVRAVHPGHQVLENTLIHQGRYINELDLSGYRKVAVIGKKIAEDLLKGRSPIGEQLEINGVPFSIVGVFIDEGNQDEEEIVYLPITTAQKAFGGGRNLNQIMFTVGDADLAESERIERQMNQLLSERLNFDQNDPGAVRIRNNVAQFQQFMSVMTGIQIFVWFIASGTILAGIIGVSNIMVIIVKERTKEIGVRKALGATPLSIVGLIMQESVFITTLAGYIGLLLGVGLLSLLDDTLTESVEIFASPEINVQVALAAMVLLVISGSLAGLVPALKAARIRPIEALRDE